MEYTLTEIILLLSNRGANKIAAIKALRHLTGRSLRDTKDLIDGTITVETFRRGDQQLAKVEDELNQARADIIMLQSDLGEAREKVEVMKDIASKLLDLVE